MQIQVASAAGSVDWVSPVMSAIGLIVSVGIVLYQLGRQHKSSLELQRSNSREALKLRIYEIFIEKAKAFAEAELRASSYARSMQRDLESAKFAIEIGLRPQVSMIRAAEFSRLNYEAARSLTEVIFSIEQWEVAFESGELFRIAFSSATHDIDDAFLPLYHEAIRIFPTDLPSGGTVDQPLPDAERLAAFSRLVDDYTEVRSTLRTYTHDLVVDAQNTLLSELFNRQVAYRNPIDPRFKVLRSKDKEELIRYFQTETAAGRSWQEAREAVAARLAGETASQRNE